MICRCHVQAVGCGHNGEWCQHFTINHCWEPSTELPGGFLAKLNQILISSTDQFGQQMPVWPVWPVSQNQLKFVQEVVVQVVSCVLLEMSLAFLGILCNLLVVTTIRHQVIFLFWSRILLTMIMIRNQEFAVYGEKTQEELQNSTTNLLLINLCFSNLLVSFLVNKLFFLKQRSVSKHLKVLEIYWNGEGRIIWNTFSWKGQSWKRVHQPIDCDCKANSFPGKLLLGCFHTALSMTGLCLSGWLWNPH